MITLFGVCVFEPARLVAAHYREIGAARQQQAAAVVLFFW
jgi:hypothetical protein